MNTKFNKFVPHKFSKLFVYRIRFFRVTPYSYIALFSRPD